MDILESNKIIALFIGYEVGPMLYGGIPIEGMRTITVTQDSLKFHKYWDWLMPVVEKIEISSIYEVQTTYDNRKEFLGWAPCLFTLIPRNEIKRLGHDTMRFKTKIEATYQAVIDFIKWYNNQNK